MTKWKMKTVQLFGFTLLILDCRYINEVVSYSCNKLVSTSDRKCRQNCRWKIMEVYSIFVSVINLHIKCILSNFLCLLYLENFPHPLNSIYRIYRTGLRILGSVSSSPVRVFSVPISVLCLFTLASDEVIPFEREFTIFNNVTFGWYSPF